MDGNTILSPTIATRRRPFAPAKAGPPAFRRDRLGEIAVAFRRLDVSGKGAIDLDEVRRFRSLMASASEDSAVELDGRDRLTRALHLLDTVLDSPLDLDAPLFEAIGDVLFLEGTSPEQKENQPENITDLEEPRDDAPCAPADAQQESPSSVRGYHVRQGGHDFVLPVDRIVGAIAADVDRLPTAFGRTVAQFSGELCDVFPLASHFGLNANEGCSPTTLMVVALERFHVCLAVDEVVGPVDASLAAIPSTLPEVRGMRGVAVLQSGRLALVPDFANLPGVPCQQVR